MIENNPIPYHFEMNYLKLTDGRYFTQEEIDSGANVAIMNKYSSVVVDGKEKLVEVGDKFKISLKVMGENLNKYNEQMNLSEEDVIHFKNDFYNNELYNDVIEVEVVGLFDKEIDYKDMDMNSKVEILLPTTCTDKMYDKYVKLDAEAAEASANLGAYWEQVSSSVDYDALEKKQQKESINLEKEKNLQKAIIDIKKKFGK